MGLGIVCGPYLGEHVADLGRVYRGTDEAAPRPYPFFVTGFPRSRTGWLANLLTAPPESFCHHDILPACGGVEDLRGAMGAGRSATGATLPSATGAIYCGVSDPALALVWRGVVAAFPAAKWVVVHRDAGEAAESYSQFLTKHGWGMSWDQVRGVIQKVERELEALAAEGGRVHEVTFDGLDRESEVKGLWDFIFEGRGPEWSGERFRMLRRMNVQTIPAKAPFDLNAEGWKRWVAAAQEGKENKVWA